ncbi:MAG TPA: hypothetical protein PKD91_02055 [Bacteroidia bacterium]|nr:hypothetical protein [Bacteroidia bacterium]
MHSIKSEKIFNVKFLAMMFASFLFFSCSPTMKIVGSWVNTEKMKDKKYKSVFIIALTENFGYKAQVENDLAEAAAARGLNAVKSSVVFPYTFSKDNAPIKELLIEKIKGSGCDAVFTSVLVDQQSQTKYVPGSVYAPMSYGYYGDFYNYYNYYTPVVYNPGYYETNKTYFLESNLYDVATGELMWSVQSQAINPSDIQNFSKQYAYLLVQQLEKEGLKRE